MAKIPINLLFLLIISFSNISCETFFEITDKEQTGETETNIYRRKRKTYDSLTVKNCLKANNIFVKNNITSCSSGSCIFGTFSFECPRIAAIRSTISIEPNGAVVSAGNGLTVLPGFEFNLLKIFSNRLTPVITFSVAFSNPKFFTKLPTIILSNQTASGVIPRSITSGPVAKLASIVVSISQVTTTGFKISIACSAVVPAAPNVTIDLSTVLNTLANIGYSVNVLAQSTIC